MKLSSAYRAAIAISEELCLYWHNGHGAALDFDVKAGAKQHNVWRIRTDEGGYVSDNRAECDTRHFRVEVSYPGDDRYRSMYFFEITLYRQHSHTTWNRADIEVKVVGNVYCTHHHKAWFDPESSTWQVRRVALIGSFSCLGVPIAWSNEIMIDGIPRDMLKNRELAGGAE